MVCLASRNPEFKFQDRPLLTHPNAALEEKNLMFLDYLGSLTMPVTPCFVELWLAPMGIL
jgi:hypothetical protein